MKIELRLSFIILSFLLMSKAGALTCSKNGTSILFVNGILNSPKGAEDSKNKLEEEIGAEEIDKSKPVPILSFDFSYNHTMGLLPDMLESLSQKLLLRPGNTLSADQALALAYSYYFNGKDITLLFLELYFTDSPTQKLKAAYDFLVNNSADEEYQTIFNQALTQLNADNIGLKQKISESLLTEKKLIIVSHSQGNLFTNNALNDFYAGENLSYTGLDSKPLSSFEKVVGHVLVATPTKPVFPNKYVVLNDKDFINQVSNESWNFILNPPSLLTDNDIITNNRDLMDHFLNHSFLTTYLNSKSIQPNLLDEEVNLEQLKTFTLKSVKDAAESLASNCGQPPVADFTATPLPGDPLTYTLDGSSSSDPDEPTDSTQPTEPPDFDITEFTWTIDKGQTFEQILSGMIVNHPFTEGEHTIELIVTDLAGNISLPASSTILVSNQAPQADFSYTTNNLEVSFDASASSDVDGSIKEYRWTIQGTTTIKSSPDYNFKFPENGNYDVQLVVVDNNGKLSNVIIKTITVGEKKGCYDPLGNLYPGKTHFNPDGSPGGYVANSANVSGNVYLDSSSLICGDSSVSGNVSIEGTILENSNVSRTGAVFETDLLYFGGSRLYNSKVNVTGSSMFISSYVKDSSVSGYKLLFFRQDRIVSSSIEANYIFSNRGNISGSSIFSAITSEETSKLTFFSSFVNSNISCTESSNPDCISIDTSTVNAPVIGFGIVLYQTISNAPISGSCIHFIGGMPNILKAWNYGCP
jgi:PKD repeat protein